MPTTNTITYEEPWLISADTNYQGYKVNLETGECIPTGKRVLRKWDALKDVFPELVRGKTFMDIGCAQGFFLFKAWECGATWAIGIEKREEYYRALFPHLLEMASMCVHNLTFPHMGASIYTDVVMCLSLVHHLFPAYSLPAILTLLASRAEETLLVEFIAPEDRMVQRKGWALEHPEYSEEAFLEIAKGLFAKVEFVNPGHHPTRKIYRMDK
jgi:hypothetical protein